MNITYFIYRRLVSHRACRGLMCGIATIFILVGGGILAPRAISAAEDAAKWIPFDIPAKGESGGWMLAEGSDIMLLTQADDGTMYACVSGLTYTLYRSTDGGRRWSHFTNCIDTITGIAVPPGDAGTIYYVSNSLVYRATNGGKNIVQLPPLPVNPGNNSVEITSIDVTRTTANIIVVGTKDIDSAEFGGVYTLEDNTVPSWVDTGIGDYDVCAVAFSPGHVRDSRLFAVMTDEFNTFTSAKTGINHWCPEARLDRNNSVSSSPVIARTATIALPDNYSPGYSSESCYYVCVDTGTSSGDVYKINEPGPDLLSPIDLDIGQAYGHKDTDISSLAVQSTSAGVTLLAGAAASGSTFTSMDRGQTWSISQKSPTGIIGTIVRISKDYISTGIMYAATAGGNSAISISRDNGVTWNQISFVDANIERIVSLAPSPDYIQDRTVFLLTLGSGNSLWRTCDGGRSWERVLCSSPDIDTITFVGLPPEYHDNIQTIFLAGESSGKEIIWESTDNGQSYCGRFNRNSVTGLPFPIDDLVVAGVRRFFIASHDNNQALIYRTDNSGFFYDNGVPVGDQPISSIILSPTYERDETILAVNNVGNIFLSIDNGASFQSIPPDTGSPPLSGPVMAAFDAHFEKNRTIYAASNADGFFRFVVNSSHHWENINANLPAGAVIWRLFSGDKGTLYAADLAGQGAIERCLNPAVSGPVFEKLTSGLDKDATISDLWTSGSQLWTSDYSEMTLLTFYDSLTVPVSPASPENEASGIGSLTGHVVKNDTLAWEPLEGATSYDWQCNNDSDFSSIPDGFQGNTQASYTRLPELEPATVYYWRVRASAPVYSPWSEKRSFTTCLDAEAVILQPESPSSGAIDVPVNPIFKWTALVDATGYELLVDTDIDFKNPSVIRTGNFTLPSNTWQSDVTLEHGVTYYWKVRATGAGSYSAWSSIGIFTTESAMIETAEKKEEAPIADPPVVEKAPETSPITLSITLMTTTTTVLSTNPTPSEPALPEPVAAQNPDSDPDQIDGLPNWTIYVVGGLLVIIILALIIMLAIVLKIRHIM